MTLEEIKSVISVYNTKIWKEGDLNDYKKVAKTEDYECAKLHSDCAKLAIKALEKELERLENKSLSIDEIRDSIGEPLWVELKDGTFECLVLRDYDDKVLEFEDSVIFYSEDEPKTYIYKYKRTESENE